jgi:hypothetical protein
MSTTTPNFNFPVPQSTDLVKDGATAIAALGTAIDTDFVDLKGGTTGQVLAKASDTDMDFSWVAQDDSNAIQNSIVDAKGDLIAASAADTPARLAVGNNGETLVADSSTSTGLRYQGSMAAGRNGVINGAFDFWQRSTSAALGGSGVVTSADRWATYSANASTTLSRQVTGDTTNLPFIQYCGRMQRTAGNTGTNVLTMANSWETVNSIPYAGRTVTLSFYARAGANYSATSNAFQAALRTGTGTDQNYTLTGYTGSSGFSNTVTLTTTWQRFSVTGTVASNVTEIATEFRWTPTGTAGANDYAEVTGVQVELGSVATTFARNGGTIQGELAACQRYYEKTYAIGTAAATNTSVGLFINYGGSDTLGNAVVTIPMQVAKRNVSYSVAVYTSTGTANSWSYARSGAAADTTMTIDLKSERTFRAYGAVGANFVVANMNGHWVVDNEL